MADKVSIYDHSTGEHIERQMTTAEQKQWDLETAANLKAQAKAKAEAEAARNLKIAAYEKMGLTPDEIEALLPTPKPIELI